MRKAVPHKSLGNTLPCVEHVEVAPAAALEGVSGTSLDLVALNLAYQLAQDDLRLIAHAAEHPCFLQVLLRLGVQPERGAELLLAALSLGLVLLELVDGALVEIHPLLEHG